MGDEREDTWGRVVTASCDESLFVAQAVDEPSKASYAFRIVVGVLDVRVVEDLERHTDNHLSRFSKIFRRLQRVLMYFIADFLIVQAIPSLSQSLQEE